MALQLVVSRYFRRSVAVRKAANFETMKISNEI